jgi:hypothetical protein
MIAGCGLKYLDIRVECPELDAFDAGLNHPVYSILSSSTYANNLDLCKVTHMFAPNYDSHDA